ncbi:Methylsterol monooxygenase 2-1, partial [Ananas comosus]
MALNLLESVWQLSGIWNGEYGAYENFGEDSSVDLCISSMFGVALRCGACSGAYLITNFSEFQLATLGTFIIHESVFFLSGLPSLLFERSGLFSKYKIQKKANTPASQDKCVLRLILYHICVNLPLMIVSYPAFKFMGLKSSVPLPPWTVVLCQILFYFILEDFVFYWGHRILHTKWLYQHIHSIHHEYATPFGLTSEYAHPAEILFLGFATVVGPALTGPHLLTLWLWVVLRVLETVEAHSGYHFPWSPSNFLPLYGGADFHDYHHRLLYTKSGNYSSTFVYMDWLFGTDKGYR